jgi:hypothetical protein
MNRNKTYKLNLGHAPSSLFFEWAAPFEALAKKGQANTTRYFVKKQNELKQTVLSFVQL